MIRDLLEIHINQDTVLLGRWGLFANFPPALRNNICSETLIRRILVDGDAVRSLRRFVALEGSAGLAANCSDHAFMRILKGQLCSGRIEVVLLPHTLPMRMLSGRPAAVREAPARMAAGRSGSGARVPARGIGPAGAGFQTVAATSQAVRPAITPSQVRSQPAGSPVLNARVPLRGGGPAAAYFETVVPAPPADRTATTAPKPVSQWTAEERIAFVVENAAGKVPGELSQALLALLSPENLALMVLVAGLFIGAHAMGWGLLADVAIVAVAYMYAGFYAVLALKDLGECFARTASAQSEQDLGIAADALVRAVAGIGVAGLSAILHRVATRQAGGGSSAPGKASNATKQPQPESRPAGRALPAKAVEEPSPPIRPPITGNALPNGSRAVGAASTENVPASTPMGRLGNPSDVKPGTNAGAVISNRQFSGHALDQMQGRGVTSTVVENAIRVGKTSPDPIPGRIRYYDQTNNLTVITESNGKVVTVITGKRR